MSEATTPSGDYEFWFDVRNEYTLQIFSNQLMRSLGFRPQETLDLLNLLEQHRVEIEQAARLQRE